MKKDNNRILLKQVNLLRERKKEKKYHNIKKYDKNTHDKYILKYMLTLS